jgi:hypothetical protein
MERQSNRQRAEQHQSLEFGSDKMLQRDPSPDLEFAGISLRLECDRKTLQSLGHR